jgi:hypothetical protein
VAYLGKILAVDGFESAFCFEVFLSSSLFSASGIAPNVEKKGRATVRLFEWLVASSLRSFFYAAIFTTGGKRHMLLEAAAASSRIPLHRHSGQRDCVCGIRR